jgi:predicted phage terminase large subunit-like protein
MELVRTERAERKLNFFIREGWRYVEPAAFSSNWHIDCMCEHYEAIALGQLKRVIFVLPPRHMKSLGGNVFFPPWVWAQDPERHPIKRELMNHGFQVTPGMFRGPGVKFAYLSYAQDLSNEHSVKSRQLIDSSWYQERWGHRFKLRDDSNRITRFDTIEGGHRLALAFGGKITGFGADIINIDDAHNIKDVESDPVREEVLRVWDEVLPTRLNDPKTGVFIVSMQRSHPRDLIGHILAKDGAYHLVDVSERKSWTVVCLPARYEPDHPTPLRTLTVNSKTGHPWQDPRAPGEPLWQERFPDDVLADWFKSMTSHAAAGQLQQRPTAREGGMFKKHWWGAPVTAAPAAASFNRVRAWDLAGTEESNKADPDWTVGALMSRDPTTNIIYIEDVIRFRGTPGEVEKNILAAAGRDTRATRIRLPRDPGQAGKFQVAHLAGKLAGWIVHPESESQGKTVRAEPYAAQVEAGNVRLVAGPWNEEFVNEHAAFPNAHHDDQVDASSGGFRVLCSIPQQTLTGTMSQH